LGAVGSILAVCAPAVHAGIRLLLLPSAGRVVVLRLNVCSSRFLGLRRHDEIASITKKVGFEVELNLANLATSMETLIGIYLFPDVLLITLCSLTKKFVVLLVQ
jgi:hypothetical protein